MKTFRLLRLDHLVIDTADLRQSLDFYARLPDVKISVEKGRGVARIGQQKINIHPYPPTLFPVAAHPTMGHQAFSLEYPGTAERFQECPFFAAGSRGVSGAEVFCVMDPDGDRIGIGFAPASPGALPRIRSLTLWVSHMKASVRFYAGYLGMEVERDEKGVLCKLGTGCIRLVGEGGGLVRGAGDFCLITDADIETVRSELAGGPLVPELGVVRRHGALGPMRSVYLRDPDGNLVEIAEYAEKRDLP